MTTISDKILKNIKEENISPAPRWKFLAKNSVFWTMFGVALLIGALSFAFIVDVIVNNDWSVYLHLHKTFLQYLILSLPYLWIVCLAVFFALAYYNFVHTKGWYHRRVYLVVLAALALSIGLGSTFVYFGINRKINQVLDAKIPYYESIRQANEQKMWDNPGDGVLEGKITEVMDENADKFVVKDSKGNDWVVNNVDSQANSAEIKVGEKVKMVGEAKDNQEFVASEIRDWDTSQIKKKEIKNSSEPTVKGAEDSKQTKKANDQSSSNNQDKKYASSPGKNVAD